MAPPDTPPDLARELRQAIIDCNVRGLLISSRWAARQLAGLSPEETAISDRSGRPTPEPWQPEDDQLALARCDFDAKVLAKRWLTGFHLTLDRP